MPSALSIQAPLAPIPNWDMANIIREAVPAYQDRIPAATQADFAQTLADMWAYKPARNQFIDALINQIGLTIFQNRVWNNKLARFKRGMLSNGSTIQEIAVGVAEAHVYDATRDYLEKMIFGREPNEAQSFYHVRNRENYYKVTIDERQLQLAFLSTDGIWKFINGLLNSAYTADNFDEFLLMIELFDQYHKLGGFWRINVPNITAPGRTALQVQEFLEAIRTIAPSLEYPSRNYNAAHMMSWSEPDELLLIINSSAMAAVDVSALAAAFNPGNTDIQMKTLALPPEHFPVEGGLAILTTPDFFVVADTVYETREAENPAALIRNVFLHHHGIVSASPFVPAILFTHTEESSVIEILPAEADGITAITVTGVDGIDVTEIQRGAQYNVFVEATDADGVSTAAKLELVGATSPMTLLKNTGTFRIPRNESATELTINAYAVDTEDYESIKATVTLPVVGTYYAGPLPERVREDADNDGLEEVTPAAPKRQANKVTIPDTEGVQYKNGAANVAAGTVIDLPSGNTTVTAVAKSGFEIKSGETATWTYTV